MIWDDYRKYKAASDNWERPTSAIDGFLVAYAGEIEILSDAKQLIARKTKVTPRGKIRNSLISSDKAENPVATRSLGNLARFLRGKPLMPRI